MKKSLLITLEYPPMIGGVSHYYKNIVEYLPVGKIWVLDNAKNELLSTSRFIWPRWLKGLMNSIKAVRRYEIEHILVGQILPIGTIALFLRLFLGVPYTVITHAMDVTIPFGEEGSKRKQWLVQKILHYADSVTTVSSYTRKQLVQLGVPKEKITLVYPCPHIDGIEIDLDRVETRLLDEKYTIFGKRIILSVGRLIPRKGFDYVLASLPKVLKNHDDIVYVIVGSGEYETDLRRMAHELGIEKQVRFVGVVDDDELTRWYARSTYVIMPSRELSNRDVEGFGIAFVEASSFGKPTIGGMSGGIVDAVVDGQTGYLVDPRDPAMISAAMIRLLDDSETATRLGLQGRERVKEKFRWSIQVARLEKMLKKL